MFSAVVLFVLTVFSVGGEASAERKLVYVTVVSNCNMCCNATEAVLDSAPSRGVFSVM